MQAASIHPTPSDSSSSSSYGGQDLDQSSARSVRRPSKESMSQDATHSPAQAPLNAHQDARALIRLIQCPACSYPLRYPVTLPCGSSICRQCLPESHARQNITYTGGSESRHAGIICPVRSCQQEHPLSDCSPNVLLIHLMESITAALKGFDLPSTPIQTQMVEVLAPAVKQEQNQALDETNEPKPHLMTAPGGRLLATHAFADSGDLAFSSDVEYTYVDDSAEATQLCKDHDADVLQAVKDAAQQDLDCQVCYNLMLDPTTTPCGHTWCRKCLARILDHSNLCPVCRRYLFLPASLTRHPNNKMLVNLLGALCPDKVDIRRQAVEADEAGVEGLDTAIFVCTPSFPTIPTYLHVFEPRYRLMIRRALESNGRFGMIAYNENGIEQGVLGNPQFMEIGTMLQIVRYQLLPDGRSFVECKGVHRFRVLSHGVLDGYVVGRVEKIEDISLSEEERIEAEETSAPAPEDQDLAAATSLDRLPTSDMLRICQDFVARNRQSAARWLQGQILEAYGEPPDDPATFPYWLASVLPMSDAAKYQLLPLSSARERLKLASTLR